MRGRLKVTLGAIGLALVGIGAAATPAKAGPDVSLYPACSIRTLPDYVTAEASCVNPNLLYDYRITIFCKINMAEGYFWDYAVVSEWRPTTDTIRIHCHSGGALIVGTYGPELQPRRPV